MWDLPGPSRWVRKISGDRREGRSGVIICPSPEDPEGLVENLEFNFSQRSFYSFDFDEASFGGETDRVDALLHGLGLPGEGVFTAASLALLPDLGGIAVLVDSRRQCLSDQSLWINFAARFASSCKELPSQTRPTLWILACPRDGQLPVLPQADINIRTWWWWGVLGPVDAVVHATESDVQPDLVAAVAEIARWDLSLTASLRNWDGSIEKLAVLDLPLENQGIAPVSGLVQAGLRPPDKVLDAWRLGVVQSWDRYLNNHIAIERRDDRLAARVWISQVARLTPFIEIERVRLAEALGSRLARGFVHPDWQGAEIESLEIGPLTRCYVDHGSRVASESRVRLLRALRDARNALAHRTPLSLSQVTALQRLAGIDRDD